MGVIRLVTGATAPTVASLKDYDGDNTPDILVSYPDRQGWIYTTQGGQLLPSAALIPPFGAVASGGGLPNEFPTEKKVFVQLAGQPGALKAYKVDASNITNVGEIASGLTGESTSTTVGYDTFNWAGVVAYVSTTEATGTVLGVSFGAFDPDDPDADPTFGNSITLPIEPTAKVRSLLLTDVNGDGLVDLLITKPGAGNAGKVVTYLRISATEFAAPVESTVTLRTGAETKGQVDFVTGTLVGDLQPDVAVLGDDRVRLYRGNATGAFVADGEISLPAGKTPTGVQFARLSDSSLGGLLVTVRDAVAPTAKQLLAYIRTVNGFQPAVVFNYTAAVSNGDTRVLVGHWGGDAQRLDVVVVDGEKVQLILDVGPST